MDIGSLGIWLVLVTVLVMVWVWVKLDKVDSEVVGRRWPILKKRFRSWERDVNEEMQTVEDDLNGPPPVQFVRRRHGVSIRERLLQALNAVDQEQLSQVEQQFELERSEILARLDRIEMTLTQQGRLENWATEVNGRLSQLELRQPLPGKKSVAHSRTLKSVLCFGIRVTITNQIWYKLGKVPPQDLSDSQIEKYVHGPFCRNCLRSLIVNNSKDSEKSVRSRCQYCSLVWREDSSSLLSLRQVKREAYEYLDAVCRRSNDLAL